MACTAHLNSGCDSDQPLIGRGKRYGTRKQVAGDGLKVSVADAPARSERFGRMPGLLGAHVFILNTIESWSSGASRMPIYEYACKECRHEFEALGYGSQKAECPKCASKKLAPKLSVFAVSAPGSAAPRSAGPCGSCGDPRGPGSCSMN